jgi:hypothetical protein
MYKYNQRGGPAALIAAIGPQSRCSPGISLRNLEVNEVARTRISPSFDFAAALFRYPPVGPAIERPVEELASEHHSSQGCRIIKGMVLV